VVRRHLKTASRRASVPNGVVELLRLFVVIFFATLGSVLGATIGTDTSVLGPFNPVWVGVIVGSGLGYVLGGVLGRTTVAVVDRTERSLRSVSAEEIVGGVFGAIVGGLLGAAVAWPVFFLGSPMLSLPLFGFAVVSLGVLGYRIGAAKKASMLGMFGVAAGMAPPTVTASSLPKLVDSSVAIDGRILAVVRSGFMHGEFLFAAPVLAELQGLADAGDPTRRLKGRRGLEVLESLRREPGVEVTVLDEEVPAVPEVDAKLVRLCIDHNAALLTLDTNLAKAASIAGIRVLNMHALTLALRPPVAVGDDTDVLLTKTGREPGQAVGYLDDGTMVVVEHARDHIGHSVTVTVTSVVTTANGRLVFARLVDAPAAAAAHDGSADDAGAATPAPRGRGTRRGPVREPAMRVRGAEARDTTATRS
jgi:uncharacterized protein YacL